MNGRDADEYRALRGTIAHRGTWRPALMLAGTIAWAGALIAVLVLLPYPLASTIPLLVLVATFESVRTLHFGSERIGRYLQVFHEEAGPRPKRAADTPSWETVAMAFGVKVPGAGGNPLFAPVFGLAATINFLAVILPGPIALELGLLAAPHLAFVVWLIAADRAMRTQRAVELARFRALHASTPREPE
ncbi:MAG: hypothetical protein ACRD2N_13885 [Vicinamibacterales bacterium]